MTGQAKDKDKDTIAAKIKKEKTHLPASVFKAVDDKKDDKATRKKLTENLLVWMRGNGKK